MLSLGHRFIIALIILNFLLLPACSSDTPSTEETNSTDTTSSSQRQASEPTQSEPTSAPPTLTSPPPATATDRPTQTQAANRQGEIYVVTDQFNAVTYFLPSEWSDYQAVPWLDEGQIIGSTISASTDLDAYRQWGAPGVSIYVSRRLDIGYLQMMEEFANTFAESCDEYLHRWDYENSLHRGRRQRFWRCGGENGPTLDLLALVSQEDWQAYTAIVVIVWFVPIEYQLNEDTLLNFTVLPENLP